jgi:subtilase family serine protease
VPPPANPQQPAADIDLSITFLATTPDPLVCNQQATITLIVVNTGTTRSPETTVLVQDLYNGAQQASASATVPPLGQNESVELNLPLTVSTFFLEGHVIRARVDPDNRVLETNEGNNEVTKAYTLAQGDC